MSNRDGDRCVTAIWAAASREGDWGTNESVVMRAVTSHQRGPGSNSGVDIICGLSLLLAHTTIRLRMVDEETLCGCAISKSLLTWIDADEVCTNFTDVPPFVSGLLFLFLLLSLYSRALYNSNLPLNRSNFHFPSDHFPYNFTLDNSEVRIIGSRLYLSVLKFLFKKKLYSHTSLISRRPSKFLSYLSKISSLISLTLSRATPYRWYRFQAKRIDK